MLILCVSNPFPNALTQSQWVRVNLNPLPLSTLKASIACALAKKKPQPIWVEVYFWWRRRELYIECKLLINIDLMSSKICFCYILCYLKYSILMPRVKMYTSFMAHQKNSQK